MYINEMIRKATETNFNRCIIFPVIKTNEKLQILQDFEANKQF